MTIPLNKTIFIFTLLLHLGIGGLIAFVGIEFRPFMATFLIIPVFLYKRLRLSDEVKVFSFILVLLVLFAIWRGLSLSSAAIIIKYALIPLFSYLVICYSGYSAGSILKFARFVVLIQLPVVVMQLVFSDILSNISAIDIHFLDIRFGTFYVKNDVAMSTFLLMYIIVLLKVKKNLKRLDVWSVISAIITIILSSSQISQVTLLLILGYFILVQFSFKAKLYSFLILMVAVLSIGKDYLLTIFNLLQNSISHIQHVQTGSREQEQLFLEGGFTRAGGILYLLGQPFKLFGTGPIIVRRNMKTELVDFNSFYIDLYAYLGVLGLALFIIAIYLVIRKIRFGQTRLLFLLVFGLLGLTNNFLDDASIMFSLFLFVFVANNYNSK